MISMPRADLLTVVRKLGLSTGLKLCLDAGDSDSYTSGQSWLDRSGNGYDFFLGATNSVTTDDPTFNGTAGRRSSSEYFSFDGGDIFQYDSANETWMNNLHKDNAKFTLVGMFYLPDTTTTQGLFSTARGNNADTGFSTYVAGTAVGFNVRTGSASAISAVNVTTLPTSSAWNFIGLTVDEAAGTGFWCVNGSEDTFTSTYTSPSSGSATGTLRIGSRRTDSLLVSGSRIASAAMWEGVAIDASQMRALFQATRGKFAI